MKKILSIFTILAFAVLLVACQSDLTSTTDVIESDQSTPVEPIRVGMDLRYPPFETVIDGVPTGISVDVAMAFGEFLGRPVEIVNTNFGSLIPSLNAGEIDVIIASMSNTPERAESINFSDTYFYFKIPSLVNSTYANANNLTEDSTTEDILAVSSTKFTGITGQISASLPESLGLTVEIATNLAAAVLNVVQGTSDVLMMSTFPVVRGHLANPQDTIVIWDAWISSPIAMGMRKDDTDLLAQANAFIATMSEPGGLYDVLRDKWTADNLDPADYEEAVLFVLERFGMDFFINEN